jgi:hypothetical protein
VTTTTNSVGGGGSVGVGAADKLRLKRLPTNIPPINARAIPTKARMIPVRRLNFYLLKVLHTEDTIDCDNGVATLEPPVIENIAFKILYSFCTTINNFNING